MFENVDEQMTDGRLSDWYTISSPMSLGLRWAKNSTPKELTCCCFNWRAISLSGLQDYQQAFSYGLLGRDLALTLCMLDNFVHAFAVVC